MKTLGEKFKEETEAFLSSQLREEKTLGEYLEGEFRALNLKPRVIDKEVDWKKVLTRT